MRMTLVAAALITAFASITSQAAEPASPHTFTGNFNFTNNYMYRGLTQTDDKPALQGGFDYSHASGVYAGTWASNISWLDASGKSSMEWDVYGGYKFNAGPVAFDVGVLQYVYPGAKVDGVTSADTTELYGAATWMGLTAKYSHAVTNLFGVEDSEGSYYPELNYSAELGSGFTASAHIGRQHIEKGTSYNDWKLGVSKEILGLTVGAYYVDTDISKPRAVFTVGKSF